MFPDASPVEDLKREVEEFSWNVPEHFNFATDVVDRWAADRSKLALLIVDDAGHEQRLTFWDMQCRSNRVANVLQGLGLGQGDPVLVMLPRVAEWWDTMLALHRLGAIAMPGTTQLTPKDLKYRLTSSDAAAVVTDLENAPKIEAVVSECPTVKHLLVVGGAREGWVDLQAEAARASRYFAAVRTRSNDPALVYFTSGTTGFPKMVLHTHASYPFAHRTTGKFWLALRPTDLHCNLSDTGWGKAAWSSLYGPWHQGACLFVHAAKGKFNPVHTLELVSEYGVTSLCAPPTAYRLFVQENLKAFDLRNLRHCSSAGEPLNPEVVKAWQEGTGQLIYDGYGQTETVVCVANLPFMEIKPGSMGKPAPGFEVAVIGHDGAVLPPNQEGDIAIKVAPNRPAGLFAEYWHDPGATESRMLGDWYLTGDRAYQDEDGYLWFVGRADDVIISAGYRIGPFEVESALIEHPAVQEAAVVASPDPVRGEIVKAFVILAPGHAPSDALAHELQEFVKQTTAPYKYPREIEFTTELPKTISGKIRRVELRELERKRKLEASPA
ncbi:MAG: AMP-binding protein [Bacillota bacterium]|nr:AMP-binding protein [Bacillota bacterium]